MKIYNIVAYIAKLFAVGVSGAAVAYSANPTKLSAAAGAATAVAAIVTPQPAVNK